MTTYDAASGMPFTDVLNRYQVLENAAFRQASAGMGRWRVRVTQSTDLKVVAGLCGIHLVRVSSCAASGLRLAIHERCWSFPGAGRGQLASARSGSGNGRGLTARSRSMPAAVSKSTCCNRRGRSPFHSRPAVADSWC
jgi:hypothetical protein